MSRGGGKERGRGGKDGEEGGREGGGGGREVEVSRGGRKGRRGRRTSIQCSRLAH